MKSRLLNAGLCACALLMMLSGCSSDETLLGDSNTAVKSMKINVSDGMFTSVDNNGAKTRATDSGTGTTFGSGDAIGIFAVMSNGTLALTNAKYTYDGTSKWLNSANTTNVPYYAGAKYFAYYPYQANLASTKYDATKTTANTFFASLISTWAPAADQSTQANYTAQDLMVSMATVDASTYSSSFAMSHQMSMVEMDLHQVHYTYNGSDTYRFTFDAANKPFNTADGKYRFLVNPNNSFSVTGKNQYNSTDATKNKAWKISGTAPAAAKYKVYKYNGASACLTETVRQNVCIGDANIGDYLYADGTTGTITSGKTIVGIIFSSELTQAQYDAGCRYGKALALKDANSSGTLSWSKTYTSPYTDQVAHPYCQIFSTCFNDVSSGSDASSSSYAGTSTNPAWYYCKNYNDGATHSGPLTGRNWYLPSIGEWWDIMENLCTWTADQKTTIKNMRTSTNDIAILISGLSSSYYSNFDTKLSAGGAGSALNHTNYYWSASEYNSSYAVFVGSSSLGVGVSYADRTNVNVGYVRAVLAY